MQNERDLKLALGWNKFNLEIIGVWPNSPILEGRFTKYMIVIPMFVICGFVFGPQMANLYFIFGNLDLVTENLATASIPSINALTKMFTLWYHRKALKSLLESFCDDWHGQKTEKERTCMLAFASTAKRISIWCTVLVQTMITSYILLRLVTIFGVDRYEESPERLVIYPGLYPYDIRPSPIFEITHLGQITAAYWGGICYSSCDSFISMLVLHACAQFANLRYNLENILSDTPEAERKPEDFRKKLTWIVKRHEHLIWFSTTIEDSFNIMLLIQMILCTIQLCVQGFQVFQMILERNISLFQIAFFVLYLSFVTAHLFVYCYVGEILLVESTGMNYSAYNSQWFNIPPTQAKYFLFIMCKSIMPLRLTAGKFGTFSLEMFSKILRTAMGYLSVLVTVSSGTE